MSLCVCYWKLRRTTVEHLISVCEMCMSCFQMHFNEVLGTCSMNIFYVCVYRHSKTINQRNYANDLIYATGVFASPIISTNTTNAAWMASKILTDYRIDFEKIQENFHRFAFIECVSSLSASFHLNNLLIAFRIISNLRVWLLSWK